MFYYVSLDEFYINVIGENESKDAVVSINSMLNNANHSTMSKTPMRRQKKGSENATKKKSTQRRQWLICR